MPIVDNELRGNAPDLTFPSWSAGNYLEDVIQTNLEKFGNSMWMTDVSTGKSINYSELLIKVNQTASSLLKRGFRPEDTLLYMAANSIEFPVVFFAVWKLGGCNACLTLNLTADDVKAEIKQTGATFILTDEERAPRILEAVEGLNTVREVLIIGQHAKCTPVEDLFKDEGPNCGNVEQFDTESPAWILYSSGTTGTPKAIIHPHRTVSKLVTLYRNRFCAQRKLLFVNKMINGSGVFVSVAGSVSHSQMYIFSDGNDETFLKAIHHVQPYQISCFPMQLAWLCRHPHLDNYNLSSVVVMNIVGSCAFPLHERQIFEKIPNLLALINIYGMSEVLGISSSSVTDEELKTLDKVKALQRHVFGSQGKIFPFNKLKVIDPKTGEKLGPGQIGEICVQTVFMTRGYMNLPEETANVIRDGWFHTGDQGYYDSDENVYVIGRYKEIIIYRGDHVLPSYIEKHLITHPAVEDAAVVGLPHEVDGERPLAFVVLKQDQLATAEELVQFINERVTDDENLRGGVRFISEIPRNDMKKIVRHQLKKLL